MAHPTSEAASQLGNLISTSGVQVKRSADLGGQAREVLQDFEYNITQASDRVSANQNSKLR